MTAVVLNVLELCGNLCGEKRYGEVLITGRNTVLLRCAVCTEEYRDYQRFLQHIFAHHYANEGTKTDWFEDPLHAERNGNVGKCSKLPARRVKLARDVKSLERQSGSEDQWQQNQNAAEVSLVCDEFPADAQNAEKEHEYVATLEKTSPAIAPAPNKLIRKVQSRAQKAQDNTDERKCDICGTIYKDKYIMRQHRRRHSGVKPYACKQCEMRFYTGTELRLHMPRHTGERKYVCSYCGQSYKNSPALRQHEMIHTNLRPHKCDQCDKRFCSTTYLRDHMLVHTKEQNHECSICKNRFSRRKALLQHMKLHADAREYVCHICGMAFNQLPALASHKKNRHKVVAGKAAGKKVELEGEELCRRCQLYFVDKAALLEHHRNTHEQEDEVVTTDAMEEAESESIHLLM